MQVGDHIEHGGVEYVVVSIAREDEDGAYDVLDGRIPIEGESGVTTNLDDGTVAWLQTLEAVEARDRRASLELEMDSLLYGLRPSLVKFEEAGELVPVNVAASLMRAACAVGYVYGLEEDPKGALLLRTGHEDMTG